MIQAMKILQLGTLDLRERIDQELVENPMLEEAQLSADDRNTDEASGSEIQTTNPDEPQSSVEREGDEVRRMLDDLERIERDFGDGRRSSGQGDGEDGDRKLQALANAPAVPKSMAEALSEELAFIELSRRKRAIAEFLIFSLDERGYLPEDLETLAEDCPLAANGEEEDTPVTVEELQWVLDRLRSLIHPALGARDLREALLLQIDTLEGEQQILRSIVANHLEDVQNNRLPRIAKATGQTLETIQEVLEQLRRLDPTPAPSTGSL